MPGARAFGSIVARGGPALRRARPGLAAIAALLAASGVAAQERRGLDILLTNAGGYQAPGLTALRGTLTAAGHRVTVVAPIDDRAGSGAALTTTGLIDYYQQSEGVWAIDGTPADAVTLALVHILREDPPDLVIAGSDIGQSAGASVVHSGTVGAAVTASRMGVPAIAVSVALHDSGGEVSATHSSTAEAVAPAAAFVVDLVRQLHETDAQGLLPARTVLNVNYPAAGSGEPAGVRFATLASVRPFRHVYAVAGASGPARVETAAGVDRAEPGSDVDLLANGFVTISVLDGSWDAGREAWEPILARIAIER